MPFILLSAIGAVATGGTIGEPNTGGDGKTLAKIRSEVMQALQNRADITSDQIDEWINDAYRDMCSEISFMELEEEIAFSTVADSYVYLLPDRTHVVYSLSINDSTLPGGGYSLVKSSDTRFREEPDWAAGYPEYFYQKDRFLVIWPKADSVYELVAGIQAKPAPLVEETDQPKIDPEWHHALVLRSKSIALAGVAETAAAADAMNSYLATIRPKQDKRGLQSRGQVASVMTPRRLADMNSRQRTPRGYNW